MKKQDLAARLARKARLSRAAAADRLDRFIHDIIAELRSGKPVSLPGLGTITPGKRLNFKSEPQGSKEGPRRENQR